MKKTYEKDFKKTSVILAIEIGTKKAAIQLRDEILEACSKRSPKEVLEEYRALYAPKKKLKDENDSAMDALK